MRLCSGGQDNQLRDSFRLAFSQRQADHPAVGCADNGASPIDADRVQRCGDDLRLVIGGRRAGARFIGRKVDADDAVAVRVNRGSRADEPGPPACATVRTHARETIGRNSAEHDDRRMRE